MRFRYILLDRGAKFITRRHPGKFFELCLLVTGLADSSCFVPLSDSRVPSDHAGMFLWIDRVDDSFNICVFCAV